jgi:hypothetical protein
MNTMTGGEEFSREEKKKKKQEKKKNYFPESPTFYSKIQYYWPLTLTYIFADSKL